MMGKTHKVAGVFVAIIASDIFIQQDQLLTIGSISVLMASSIVGSLLPDIDKKESIIGRKLWFISCPIYIMRFLVKILSYLSPVIFLPLYKRIYKSMGHRYFAHSIFAWFGVTGYLFFLYNLAIKKLQEFSYIPWIGKPIVMEYVSKGILSATIGISIGMISHIILDMHTKDGVAILMPISDKKFRFLITVKTNGIGESIFCFFLWISIILFSVLIYLPTMKDTLLSLAIR